MHLFKFLVDLFGWVVSPIDSIWSPTNKPPIKLWKVNPNGSPKLPTKVPNPIPYCPIWGHDALRSMERENFINFELSKDVES